MRALDWDLHYVTPLLFLERYTRLFGLDVQSKTSLSSSEKNNLNLLARQICRAVFFSQISLNLKPSQVASSAIILAINLTISPIAKKISGI